MSGLKAKTKICAGCGHEKHIWKANPPMCKDCCGREKAPVDPESSEAPVQRSTLKAKPKPRVNGKPIYVALYMAKLGYGDADFMPSELSGSKAIDIHHISSRGLGGTNTEDRIENLMALTREEHEAYGDKKQYMAFLYRQHWIFLETHGVKFSREWISAQVTKHMQDEE